MEYTACRSTLHQGFVSDVSVCEHKSWIMSVPLLPSTADSAAYLRYIDDCAAGFPNAISERTGTNIIKEGKLELWLVMIRKINNITTQWPCETENGFTSRARFVLNIFFWNKIYLYFLYKTHTQNYYLYLNFYLSLESFNYLSTKVWVKSSVMSLSWNEILNSGNMSVTYQKEQLIYLLNKTWTIMHGMAYQLLDVFLIDRFISL